MARKKKRASAGKKGEIRGIYNIVLRYALVFLSSIGGLWIFYFLFTPLTVYSSLFILKLFYPAELMGRLIFVRGEIIEISKACVAGAAYFLLFMLNMITREIKAVKRMLIFLFSSFLLLLLNVGRITVLSAMKVNGSSLFNSLHMFFWYFVSIVYVFIVWIIAIAVFKIKAIPFYSDFLYIKSLGKRRRK